MLYTTYIDYHGAPYNFPVCPCVKTTLTLSLCLYEWMVIMPALYHTTMSDQILILIALGDKSPHAYMSIHWDTVLWLRDDQSLLTHWRCMYIEAETNCIFLFWPDRGSKPLYIFGTQHKLNITHSRLLIHYLLIRVLYFWGEMFYHP